MNGRGQVEEASLVTFNEDARTQYFGTYGSLHS